MLAVASVPVAAGIGIRTWIRSRLAADVLHKAHDVSMAVYANTGLLYGIVLGLVTVNGMERHVSLTDAVNQEASCLLSIARVADLFPDADRKAIRSAVQQYANDVATSEFVTDAEEPMQHEVHLDAMWHGLAEMLKADSVISSQERVLLEKLSTLQEVRMVRLGLIGEKIHPMMWSILIGGGVLMVLFLVAFDPLNQRLHTILFVAVSVTITSVLLLVYAYNHPTDGLLKVDPQPFLAVAQSVTP